MSSFGTLGWSWAVVFNRLVAIGCLVFFAGCLTQPTYIHDEPVEAADAVAEPEWALNPPEKPGWVPFVVRVSAEKNQNDAMRMSKVADLSAAQAHQEYIRVRVFSVYEEMILESNGASEVEVNERLTLEVNNYASARPVEEKQWVHPFSGDWVVLYYGKSIIGE